MCAERDKTSSVDELSKLQDSVKSLQERCAEITELVKVLDEEIETLEKQIQGVCDKSTGAFEHDNCTIYFG